jgi:nucleotide-binding universal stress UspA family protein
MLLVAVDIEGCAGVVCAEAAQLAKDLGQETVLCTCVQPPDGLTWGAPLHGDLEGRTVEQALVGDATRALQMLARGFDTPVSVRVLEGPPVEKVIEAAEELKPRMLVLGTHARKGVARWFQGSVAEEILRRSHWPVHIVPGGDVVPHPTAVRTQLDVETQG